MLKSYGDYLTNRKVAVFLIFSLNRMRQVRCENKNFGIKIGEDVDDRRRVAFAREVEADR